MLRRRRTIQLLIAASLACGLSFTRPVLAQQDSTTAPQAASGRPLLEQLDRESRSLVQEVEQSVVRVQLPTPAWLKEITSRENPLNRFGPDLSEDFRKQLQREMENLQNGRSSIRLSAELMPTTRPDYTTSATPTTLPSTGLTLIPSGTVNLGLSNALGQPMALVPSVTPDGRHVLQLIPARAAVTNNVGVVLDSQGHFLVPTYVDKASLEDGDIKILMADGQSTSAHFVGSDRMTNLTIFQMDRPLGRPARLTNTRPSDGAIVLVVAPNTGLAHLSLWSSPQAENGVAVGMDGAISGVARTGQFLCIQTCQPVIQQLINTGSVKRATLGVTIVEIRPDDPLRQQQPALGRRPAMVIQTVQPNPDMPAQRAGLKTGDVILALDGQEVGDVPTFAAVMASATSKSELQILRDGQMQKIEVDLEAK